jgi:protein-L-isoaspartate(D-aspartate) O-methyltransferase
MSQRVRAVFEAVPRRDFLPRRLRRFARQDSALEIGYGATNSQPTTVRNMLELLDVQPGQRVLDVGSGSAWTTALLAELVGPEGEVLGVEVVPELVEIGRFNLGGRWAHASISLAAEGVLGMPERAPYDRILVSAGATRLPGELVEQLAEGGLLVVPVDGVMHRVRRTAEGTLVERHGRYSFVPLKGG